MVATVEVVDGVPVVVVGAVAVVDVNVVVADVVTGTVVVGATVEVSGVLDAGPADDGTDSATSELLHDPNRRARPAMRTVQRHRICYLQRLLQASSSSH